MRRYRKRNEGEEEMRIDAHHHFWNPNRRVYYWMDAPELAPIRRPMGPDDLAPVLVENSIGGSILVQTIPDLAETAEFLALAAENEFVKGVVGWVDLTDPEVGKTLERLRNGPGGAYLKGIRHQAHDEADKSWLSRPDVIRGIGICGDHGLAQDLLVREAELPAALRCVEALPNVRFVVDHIAKPRIAAGEMQPWLGLMSELAERPNVACKLSGMITEADWHVDQLQPYGRAVIGMFGADRVLFGSDWPVCLLAGSYGSVVEAAQMLTEGLAQAGRDAVFGGNAARIYQLDP
jgi:L-fuconolactonase